MTHAAALLGQKENITSGRIIGIGNKTYQVEAAMHLNGFAVHLNASSTAKYLADLFLRAAEVLEANERGVPYGQ